MKLTFRLFLVGVVALVFSACDKNTEYVDAKVLINDFRTNQKKAVELYLDKEIVVAVPIQVMLPNGNDGIMISYNDYIGINNIEFYIPKIHIESAKKIKVNTVQLIQGICSEGGGSKDVIFRNCKVIQ
ncbi:MAG: hypothetical protein EAZ07_04245 [Cytophagales bacterium]|nr:MAG: hypothetical protein EAZ07_04245 [Cytophagales bacterium]